MWALGFWAFLVVLVICDTWLFYNGYNGIFHKHKGPEEEKLRELIIAKRRAEVVKIYHEGGYSPLSTDNRREVP